MPIQTFIVSKNNSRRSCSICYKHNKDPNSCPSLEGNQCITIAGFQCGYCKEFGHTIKHCQVLKSNQAVAERNKKDQASWKLLTLDEYRARGAKIPEPAKAEPEDDGFTVVRSGRGSKKPTNKPAETISKPKNAFANLPEVHFESEIPAVKPAAQTKHQQVAAAAWGTFVKRKEEPSWLLPNPEPQSKVLNQVADDWIEKHNAGFMPPCPLNPREPELICTTNLKTGATTFAKGKRWADFESDDDDSWGSFE